MTRRDELTAQLAEIQAKLSVLNNAPVDTYPLGTIARFSADSNKTQWHIIKKAEEAWTVVGNIGAANPLVKTTTTMDLANWILKVSESNLGYFELYILVVAETPIYASA